MAEYVLMPQKGLTEESAILAAWHVKKGDIVKKGDYLFDIETGKAVFSIESETDGTVLATFGQEGDEILIKEVVAIIGQPGEAINLPAGATPAPAAVAPATPTPLAPSSPTPATLSPASAPATVPASSPVAATPSREPGARIFASPKAKAVAVERGIDLQMVPPTGPGGRIVRDDVIQAATGGAPSAQMSLPGAAAQSGQVPEAPDTPDTSSTPSVPGTSGTIGTTAAAGEPFTVVRNSNIRKVIARNMHQSLQQMAQLTLFASFDATGLLEVRDRLKARSAANTANTANATSAASAGSASTYASATASGTSGAKTPGSITINDMIVFAVSRTILDFPALNAHFNDEHTTLFHDAHIGIAVDTKNGLIVPTMFHANRLSLRQIAETAKQLATACQEGKATPQMLAGATFTTTNLGALRIEAFTPVIAPPQTGILGIGCIDYKVRKEGDAFVHYPAIGLSLTFDHRAVDGAPAARFLKALCERLEDYFGLLIE